MGIRLQSEALSRQWVDELVEASAGLEPTGQGPTVIEFTIGKKRAVLLELADGRVLGMAGSEVEAEATIPSTDDQLAAFLDGSDSMAQAYMRGDVKPVGPTGAFLPLIEVMENLAGLPSDQS